MGFRATTRLRLSAAAFLVALAAACGGNNGGDVGGPPSPSDPPAAPPPPAPLIFGVFPAAAVVLGQSSFSETTFGDTLATFSFPGDPAVTSDGRLIVLDSRNVTVKTFSSYDTTPTGRAADFEIDVDLGSISTAGSKVVMTELHQVKILNSWPTAAGPLVTVATAGLAAGGCDADSMTFPGPAMITPGGKLIVVDEPNHRVLIWNSIPDSGSLGPANVVIGQRDMDDCAANAGGVTSAEGLSSPRAVWSDDKRLVVSDHYNNRVLIWSTFPTTFQSADQVIGQTGFADSDSNAGGATRGHTLSNPWGVDVNDRGQLAVADTQNNRVLIWNAIPEKNGQAADQVIGQPDFLNGDDAASSASTFRLPRGVRFHNRNLIVAAPEENRVLIWRALD